jgi:hypothetical protein
MRKKLLSLKKKHLTWKLDERFNAAARHGCECRLKIGAAGHGGKGPAGVACSSLSPTGLGALPIPAFREARVSVQILWPEIAC